MKRAPRNHAHDVSCGTLWQHLLPHQKVGVQQIVHQFQGRCLLADEMGLGKTLQAVAVMLHYKDPALVICPAFLQTSWRRVLQEWSVDAEVCTYDTVRADHTSDMVVVDEAHYLKTQDSQRTQNILPIILRAKHAVLMSGTPCPNRPEELFPLLHALRPSIVPSFQWFASRYCNPRRTKFCVLDTRGTDRPRELAWLLQRAFQIRRTKLDVLPHLPAKVQETLYVASCPDVAKQLVPLRERAQQALRTGSQLTQTLIMEMYRTTCQAKLHSAVELVARMQHGPTLIFAHHRVMLDHMEKALPESTTGRIDGSMSVAQRQTVVDQFQTGKLQSVVLSMAAAGVGLTLTKACTAFFLEIPWNPATLYQCEDRLHRIGQTQRCHIYYVLSHDTLDDYVWQTIHRKSKLCSRLGL